MTVTEQTHLQLQQLLRKGGERLPTTPDLRGVMEDDGRILTEVSEGDAVAFTATKLRGKILGRDVS